MPAPGQYFPRHSGPHRIACIALYRALLEQCPRISLPPNLPDLGRINPIKHFIRRRFQQNKKLQSERLTLQALKDGYACESLLRAAGDGTDTALKQVHGLLRRLASDIVHSREVSPRPPPRSPKPRVWPYLDAPKVLDIRPLPLSELSGKRGVPKLATANSSLPFLRFKKPQSPFLNRVLNDKVEQKQKRFNWINDMSYLDETGALEDKWEDTVNVRMEREGLLKGFDDRYDPAEEDESGWGDGPRAAKQFFNLMLTKENQRERTTGTKMIKIMDEEKELWEKERRLRRRLKNDEKMKRKRELGKDTEASD